MIFTPINWEDGTTSVNASNMNRIETGLSDAANEINGIHAGYFTTLDDLIAYAKTMVTYQMNFIMLSAEIMTTLCSIETISKGIIVKIASSSVLFDLCVWPGAGLYIFCVRYNSDGTWSTYRYSGTLIT